MRRSTFFLMRGVAAPGPGRGLAASSFLASNSALIFSWRGFASSIFFCAAAASLSSSSVVKDDEQALHVLVGGRVVARRRRRRDQRGAGNSAAPLTTFCKNWCRVCGRRAFVAHSSPESTATKRGIIRALRSSALRLHRCCGALSTALHGLCTIALLVRLARW